MIEIKEEISRLVMELEQYPEDDNRWNELGVGYYLLGKYDESISTLKKALHLNPKKEAYHFNLANSFSESNMPEQAMDHYLQALDLKADHIPSLNNLADLYEVMGELEKALELFRYLTNINPGHPLSFFNLGNFHLRQNRHIEAAKCYETAIELDSAFADAYFNIAWILQKAGVPDKASEYAERGLIAEPGHEDLKKLLKEINR